MSRPPCDAVVGVVEMRQRRRIAGRPRERRGAKRRQRLRGDHPGRHRGGEILAEERPERLILPRLHVARRPVVEQAEAENVRARRADRNGVAEFGRHADIEAEFQLEIHVARRPIARRRFVRALALAARPLERRAADADRRGAAVIGDGHVFVVRQQRRVGPERAAGIGGVEHRGVEIGEVRHRDRHQEFRLRQRHEMPAAQRRVALAGTKSARKSEPQRRPGLRPERHQRIELWRRAGARRLGRQSGERAGSRRGRDIEHLVADGDADAGGRARGRAKNAERQILNRKIGVGRVGAVEEAPPRGIVGFVERMGHERMPAG